MRRPTPVFCVLLALSPCAAADVLQVPGDSATIQGAIDIAVNGDEVVVAPGTYHEQIDFRGKAIVVRSSDGAASTIIDGNGTRRGVHVHFGEGLDTVLDGFTIRNCFTTANGAGLLIRTASSPTIRDCVIERNVAVKSGGGVAIRDNSSPLLENCTIQDNRANRFGAGVFVETSTPVLTDCLIAVNDVLHDEGDAVLADSYRGGGLANLSGGHTVMNTCRVRQNRAHSGGGGIYNRDSNPVLTGCVIEQNRVIHEETVVPVTVGGGMWNDTGSTATLNSCLIAANHTAHKGGGLANTAGGVAVLDDTRVLDNLATDPASQGGGVYNHASTLTMDLCNVERNSAGTGGGVMNHGGGSADLEDTDLLGNVAIGPEGRGGGLYTGGSSMSGTNALFEDNEAAIGGGLACVDGGSVALAGCTVRSNRATRGGGGLYNEAASPLLDQCGFESNQVTTPVEAPVPGLGGGMWNAQESTPAITRCSFTGNLTTGHGGGMANTDDSAATIEDCPFVGNGATSDDSEGGGMFNRNASPTVNACRFEGNAAAFGGGMANVLHASPALTACTVIDNTATQVGGGLRNADESDPAILGGEITGNEALVDGGGLASTEDSMPKLSRAVVCENLPNNVIGPIEEVQTQAGGNEICVPPPPPPPVPGDVNGDGLVNVDDLVALIAAWGTDDADADLNEDGVVNVDDLTEVLMNWT
jgi:parallel beta-helix repeat protein